MNSPEWWDCRLDAWLVIIAIVVAGVIMHWRHQKKFEAGEIPGVRKSKNLVDFMFYYFNGE